MRELLFLWQLPQNLLGLLLLAVFNHERTYVLYGGTSFYYSEKIPSGVSFGEFVILNVEDKKNDKALLHEYGHSIQSRYLGPLYLLVIGLPSLLGNIYDSVFHTKRRGWTSQARYKWYYSQPWEAWADRMGNVERKFDA